MNIEKEEEPVKQYYTINIVSNNHTQGRLDYESINFLHMGRYIQSVGSKYSIPKEILNMSKLDTANLSNAKIYRFPKLSLPRDKMETIHKKYGSKVIRDKNKADLAVISEKYFESFFQFNWNNPNYNSIEELKTAILDKNFLQENEYNRIDEFLSNLEGECCFYVKHQYYYQNATGNAQLNNFIQKLTSSSTNNNGSSGYVPFQKDSDYSWLVENHKLLCWDYELSQTSTEDSVILTEETYNNMTNMINSDDLENVSMGMEMMANCNIDKSFTYLALLFFFKFEDMKRAKNWNHVNFKSLKERFNNYMTSSNLIYSYPYDRLIQNLVKDDALTEFAVQTITKKMFNTVLGRVFGSRGESVFDIDPSILVLKEKYLKKICKENLELDDVPFF